MSEITTPTTENITNAKRSIYIPTKGAFVELFVNSSFTARSLRKLFGTISKIDIPKNLPESNTVVRYLLSLKEAYDMFMDQSKDKEEHATIIGKTTAESMQEAYTRKTLTQEQFDNIVEHEKLFKKSLINRFGEYCVYDNDTRQSIIYKAPKE